MICRHSFLDVVRSVLISLLLHPCFYFRAVYASMDVTICITTPQCQTLMGKKPDILKDLQEHLPVGRLLLFMLLAR